jgi:hypothetical protein
VGGELRFGRQETLGNRVGSPIGKCRIIQIVGCNWHRAERARTIGPVAREVPNGSGTSRTFFMADLRCPGRGGPGSTRRWGMGAREWSQLGG